MTATGEIMRCFEHYVETDPQRTALVDPLRGTMTFEQTAAAANRVSNYLLAHPQFRTGGVALVLMPDGVEQVVVQRGVLQVPLYMTALNRHLTIPEIAHITNDSGAFVLFTTEEYVQTALAAVEAAGAACQVVDVGDLLDGVDAGPFAECSEVVRQQTSAGSRMFYTSGTTGSPKGVRRPLRDVSVREASQLLVGRGDTYGVDTEAGVFLSTAPMYHTAGSAFMDQALSLGHTVVIAPKWNALTFVELVSRYRVTWVYLVPLMMSDLVDLPQETTAQYDLSSLQRILHTAAPCPPHVKRRIIEWLGPVVVEIYGGTEGSATFITSEEWLRRPGSVGRATQATRLTIRDADGQEVPPRTIGRIYFEYSGLPFSYHGAPEKTAAAKLGSEITLGDLGYVDEDGYLYVTGRDADLIISGGVNIYPAEIEHALLELPDVVDVCVVGRKDDRWGESVHAAVVLRDPTLDTDRLAEQLRDRLAGYKIPRSWEVRDQLPRSEAGKLLRRVVRDELAVR